jgi:hypothetical protein
MLAGEGTRHAGYGPCVAHGRAEEHRAWELALEIAAERQVSPWDALLLGVRLAAGRVAWVDEELRRATRLAEADPDGAGSTSAVRNWLKESRLERTLLARTAKAAIDAGVAERLVRQVELEGQLVAEVLGRTLDALELSAEQRQTAFAVAHRELLALESADGPVTDGQ